MSGTSAGGKRGLTWSSPRWTPSVGAARRYAPDVSYDLAVWVGERPSSDAAAGAEFKTLAEALDDLSDPAPTVPQLRAFLDDLAGRFPNLGTPGAEHSPWAVGPEPGDVDGGFACLIMTYAGARGSLEAVVEIARRHGLVCFDPQSETLL